MNFEIMVLNQAAAEAFAVDQIIKCNEYTSQYGLVLTPQQAIELIKTRTLSLKRNGRVEFGGGAVEKLIKAFCDSPYISMHHYVETINELVDLFYYYKNETLDRMSDDDLIEYMKNSFDGVCEGSLELLADREMAKMARNLRYGLQPDYSDEEEEDEDEDEY